MLRARAPRHGYGLRGWPEAALFDAREVSGALREVAAEPDARFAPGRRLVISVRGENEHELRVLVRPPSGIETRSGVPVELVPTIVGA
jgi:hypothetical protein